MAENVLYIAHVESDGLVGKPALEALTCAIDLAKSAGTPLVVGVFGENTSKALEQIGSCGASQFLTVSGGDFKDAKYASDAFAVEAICRKAQPSLVISAGTSRISRVMPGVAHRVEGAIETHASEVIAEAGNVTVRRWIYRQRMESVVSRAQRPWFILVDSGNYSAWAGASAQASVETIAAELPEKCKRSKVLGIQAPGSGEQTIKPEADILLVAGAGWTKKQSDGQVHANDARELILGFLGKAKASLGGSKSMVDLDSENKEAFNFMTHLNQVGQTGTSPRHQKGLSTCCHGEEPHAVGWRFINERRAVNLDANCGWARGKADVLYVADAFQVMKKVNELLG